MAKKTELGSTKRYGPRYGRRNKDKVAFIEKQHRGLHKCPFCNYVKTKRLSRGIWECEKCHEKFAGKAYTFEVAKKTVKRKSKEEIALEMGDLKEEPKEEKVDYNKIEEPDDSVEESEKEDQEVLEDETEDIPQESEESDEQKAEVA